MVAAQQMTNYWLVVTSPENFSRDREVLHFSMQGLPLRNRSSLQRMQIGDRIVFSNGFGQSRARERKQR
jgi:predicted RNA-binding protein with PUA-like domain